MYYVEFNYQEPSNSKNMIKTFWWGYTVFNIAIALVVFQILSLKVFGSTSKLAWEIFSLV